MSKRWLFVLAGVAALAGCSLKFTGEATIMERWNKAATAATEKATVNTVTTINEVKEVTK